MLYVHVPKVGWYYFYTIVVLLSTLIHMSVQIPMPPITRKVPGLLLSTSCGSNVRKN